MRLRLQRSVHGSRLGLAVTLRAGEWKATARENVQTQRREKVTFLRRGEKKVVGLQHRKLLVPQCVYSRPLPPPWALDCASQQSPSQPEVTCQPTIDLVSPAVGSHLLAHSGPDLKVVGANHHNYT